MAEWIVKDPRRLSKEKLVEFVRGIQELLFLDVDPEREFWNPEKEWPIEYIETISDMLSLLGLTPEERGPKEWTPRQM